jgi:hypothetical protein
MPSSTSNLFVDEQQAATAVVVATACKTLDEARARSARARERATALAWEKEKTIPHHLKQQLAAAQEITIPQGDNDDRSIDAGSNPDVALAVHLHA